MPMVLAVAPWMPLTTGLLVRGQVVQLPAAVAPKPAPLFAKIIMVTLWLIVTALRLNQPLPKPAMPALAQLLSVRLMAVMALTSGRIIQPLWLMPVFPAAVKTIPALPMTAVMWLVAGQNAKAITVLLLNAILTMAKLIYKPALPPAAVIVPVRLGLLIKVVRSRIIIAVLNVILVAAATQPAMPVIAKAAITAMALAVVWLMMLADQLLALIPLPVPGPAVMSV